MTRKRPAAPPELRFRTQYDHQRPRVNTGRDTPVKQSFKEETDVNRIIAKYQQTGAVSHANRFAPRYGEADSQDFHKAMTLVVETQQAFDALPSALRRRFSNDPAEWVAWLETADTEDLRAAGLVPGDVSEPETIPTGIIVPQEEVPEPTPRESCSEDE